MSPDRLQQNHEPWLAVALTKLIPGFGHFYAQQWRKGGMILAIVLFCQILTVVLLLSPEGGIWVPIGLFLCAAFVIPIWAMIDAHRTIRQQNDRAFEASRKQTKDAWLATFLSQWIPGLGHFYLGQWFWGIGLLLGVIWPFSWALGKSSIVGGIGLLIAGSLNLVSPAIAYMTAPAPTKRNTAWLPKFVAVLLFSLVLSLLMPVFVRTFVMEARYIVGGSMRPSLEVADRVIIDKVTYRQRSPQRGDIILFTSPTDQMPGAALSRVIGLPGESISIKSGQVRINGQLIPTEKYILESPDYTWESGKIPNQQYVVLGDNRNNSFDSHLWGTVPRQNIIGKAVQRFYPFDRAGMIK
jgi:signal peptidase I